MFDNNEERTNYELGDTYVKPYVSAIKVENGGGVDIHYNIPDNVLCMLILKDKSNVYITDENTFNYEGMQPYKEDAVSAIFTNRCTTIGNDVFWGYKHLSSVTIPDSVTSIGNCIFVDCSSLSKIIIPPSVNKYGNSLFARCTSLSRVTLNNNFTELYSNMFMNCTSLEHISLPNTLNKIYTYAFKSCGLKELVIPEGVTEIEISAIIECPDLESVTFPSSLKKVGSYGFLDKCDKLREIKVMGTKNLSDILPFDKVKNKSDLTLYVDSSLIETYKGKRNNINGHYNISPLE